jgi:hypothetical protein
MVPIQIARGFVYYWGKATMQMGGGSPPAPTDEFDVDNAADPGNMTAPAFVPFSAVVTKLSGGVPEVGYAGTVDVSCTAKPGATDPTMFVNGVQDDPITGWSAGVSTDTIEWVMPDLGTYTFQLDDGVTISLVDVECV